MYKNDVVNVEKYRSCEKMKKIVKDVLNEQCLAIKFCIKKMKKIIKAKKKTFL